MIIRDEGYVLSAKKYGEKALIVTILSKNQGKISGFVSEGLNKKNRGLFLVGNKISFEGASRLEEHMKRLFRIELLEPNANFMMSDFKRLKLANDVAPMIMRLLNENEETPLIYQTLTHFFKAQTLKEMLTYYAYFEFYALEYLGFPLSLDCCAVTGETKELAYVSPKSGKAVSRAVGAPYHDRLFVYPQFVVDKVLTPSYVEIFNVLNMTEFFLKEHFFKRNNLPEPKTRCTLRQYFNELF